MFHYVYMPYFSNKLIEMLKMFHCCINEFRLFFVLFFFDVGMLPKSPVTDPLPKEAPSSPRYVPLFYMYKTKPVPHRNACIFKKGVLRINYVTGE